MKYDGAAVWSGLPRSGESGLERLGLAIEANQDTASKVAHDFGLAVFDEKRIKRFRFAMETEMELATRLAGRFGADERRPAQNQGKNESNAKTTYHWVTSCDGRTS
jgi:hypothetical protein